MNSYQQQFTPDDHQYINDCANVIASQDINLTEENILDLLQINKRWPKGSMETINHSSYTSAEYFDCNNCLIYSQWKRLYDLGFTTHLTDILDLTKDLRELNNKLYDIKGSNTVGNLYLTKGSNSRRVSFPLHNHEYLVIVKPIYGSCTWQVGNDTSEYGPGDLIIIPPGMAHCVHESTEPRLSLTLNLTA